MIKKVLLITLFLLGSFNLQANEFAYTNKSTVQNIYTFDIDITEEYKKLSEKDTVMFDIPYSNIRTTGVIIQMYYSIGVSGNSLAGKSQWHIYNDMNGIVLNPNVITLPIGRWMAHGLLPTYKVRIVILTSKKE